MPGDSSIEWTEKTWNPVTGCFEVSPGCAHCYAKTFAERWRGVPGHPYEQGFDLKLHPDRLEVPLRWRKSAMIFVNSMGDLFHEDVPTDYIAQVFAVMAAAHWHTFQVLTKRHERMAELTRETEFVERVEAYVFERRRPTTLMPSAWPLPNVWLGVSIENRRFVHRADYLREVPAAVRFVSAEPLLGPLVHDAPYRRHPEHHREARTRLGTCWVDGYRGPQLDLTGIDWLIAGGESGPGHRPMDPRWARDLRDACLLQRDICEVCGGYGALDALHGGPAHMTGPSVPCPRRHTAFFFKQWGGARPTSGGRVLDGRTWDEMPQRALGAA